MSLKRDLAADLVVDIRFSDRKIASGMNAAEETSYKELCRRQLGELFINRHSVKFDRCGWPQLSTFCRTHK